MMTIKEALAFGRRQLALSSSSALDARLLLEYVLQKNHAYLVAHTDKELTTTQETHYLALIGRAARREPIPYLTGNAPFYGRDFQVSPAVLIPRPETEHLVEAVLNWAKEMRLTIRPLHIVDVGTGSGCIAITLALLLPDAFIEACDISSAALEIARQNAYIHRVEERIQFHQGSMLDPVTGEVHLVTANLPYVADHEWTIVGDGVKLYEPDIALRGGHDGLNLIRLLLDQAAKRLAPGGAIYLEIGWQQGAAVQSLAQSHFPSAKVDVLKDLAGLDRIVEIVHAK
jgi:release factor glutamine methyltransferase